LQIQTLFLKMWYLEKENSSKYSAIVHLLPFQPPVYASRFAFFIWVFIFRKILKLKIKKKIGTSRVQVEVAQRTGSSSPASAAPGQ
jgi:hypothetical protein